MGSQISLLGALMLACSSFAAPLQSQSSQAQPTPGNGGVSFGANGAYKGPIPIPPFMFIPFMPKIDVSGGFITSAAPPSFGRSRARDLKHNPVGEPTEIDANTPNEAPHGIPHDKPEVVKRSFDYLSILSAVMQPTGAEESYPFNRAVETPSSHPASQSTDIWGPPPFKRAVETPSPHSSSQSSDIWGPPPFKRTVATSSHHLTASHTTDNWVPPFKRAQQTPSALSGNQIPTYSVDSGSPASPQQNPGGFAFFPGMPPIPTKVDLPFGFSWSPPGI